MTKYRFISDPGHGWLEVPLTELQRICPVKSQFSYKNGVFAYLEEDCDMPKFLRIKDFISEPYELIEVYQENTPIRGYNRLV